MRQDACQHNFLLTFTENLEEFGDVA
jgi:hypothetical protein